MCYNMALLQVICVGQYRSLFLEISLSVQMVLICSISHTVDMGTMRGIYKIHII